MPINAPMLGLAGAVTAFWCLVAPDCSAAPVQDGGFLGPLNVQRFNVLKERLGIPQNGGGLLSYFDNSTYHDVMNILIDNVLRSEGSKYCLTLAYANRPLGMLFYDMVQFVDTYVKDASPDEMLRDAIVERLAVAFPCSRK